MAWKLPTTRVIETPEPVEINGVRYPANIFALWTPGELAAIGIQTVPAPAPSRAEQEYRRSVAYREEADPLWMAYNKAHELDVDDAKAAIYKAAWADKVLEIQARYPYPVE